ncbi:hypothetical protein VTL71DRAFT_3689 [Oculimacula yallundae]|uniref:Uncharacterized protein n=1 Tax=Oculimacula yallundae TaxID=86028 RepID=A0ABR4C3N1_9HELO
MSLYLNSVSQLCLSLSLSRSVCIHSNSSPPLPFSTKSHLSTCPPATTTPTPKYLRTKKARKSPLCFHIYARDQSSHSSPVQSSPVHAIQPSVYFWLFLMECPNEPKPTQLSSAQLSPAQSQIQFKTNSKEMKRKPGQRGKSPDAYRCTVVSYRLCLCRWFGYIELPISLKSASSSFHGSYICYISAEAGWLVWLEGGISA